MAAVFKVHKYLSECNLICVCVCVCIVRGCIQCAKKESCIECFELLYNNAGMLR